MSVPDKYKKMGDFKDYYTGKKRAPIFTIFIGGNHEASTYLEELKYGGFVAPNIYYMGRSSVVWYKGLRIGGLSGIYSDHDFMVMNKSEYDLQRGKRDIRAVYHYRKDDFMKLRILDRCNQMVMVSHDWPEGIYNYGNLQQLLSNKPFFKADIQKKCLGSPFNMQLLQSIRPAQWFSAHLHVRFTASVPWNNFPTKRAADECTDQVNKKPKLCDENEIELDIEEGNSVGESNEIELSFDSEEDVQPTVKVEEKPTKFLSLDKCLPRRRYLEFIDVDMTDSKHISRKEKSEPLYYDEEYIAAMKTIEKYKDLIDKLEFSELLDLPTASENELKAEKDKMKLEFQKMEIEEYKRIFNIPMNSFVKTADAEANKFIKHVNPQTTRFEENFLQNLG
ncbi:hypothetical protein CANINC_001829 [Pichia inconspicua]|uniref:Lariat debranching enzyme C-terminal domain-containing protein n=1 Tax=Pichia inconspicua TaxID=52247 RepID=A0A4T0X324_9ASCO|nr:hypothetical protein CANINC_001829 [[Candida] inconspicua]